MDKVLPPESDSTKKAGAFSLAVTAAVRAEIARLDWTEEKVVERAEWLHDACEDGYVPGLGTVVPFPVRPGLADRLQGGESLDLDDIEAVAFVLGEDYVDFARRVVEAGEEAIRR